MINRSKVLYDKSNPIIFRSLKKNEKQEKLAYLIQKY